jgi:FMN phosphatase YigB (HAD superfamily)
MSQSPTLVAANAIHSHQYSPEHFMTLTLLVDLDDTLLGNKMETFLPAYLGALGLHLADYVSPKKMAETMIAATQCMFINKRPDRTLKEAFDPCFYPTLGLIETECREIFDQFYAEIFPILKDKTQYRSEAVEFIKAAFARGYQIGIATNPAFPQTAIIQRLEWAGLSHLIYPFSLIPSYETFHFTKPNPAYFAEFLTRIGWPDGPVLMIGNDPDHDIRGSRGSGLSAFWVSEEDSQFPEGNSFPNGSGTLDELLAWIDNQPPEALNPDFSTPSAITATLRGSPAGLSSLLSGTPSLDWSQQPQPDAWCLTEIACHLRDVEREVNLPRLRKIIQEDNPFIPGVDSDTWADERGYIDQDGPRAFEEFVAARIESLEILDQLGKTHWKRPVRHAIFGPTDLKEIIQIMAGHERLHGRQICEVITKHT